MQLVLEVQARQLSTSHLIPVHLFRDSSYIKPSAQGYSLQTPFAVCT